jgi:biopolymer transport protein ExbD
MPLKIPDRSNDNTQSVNMTPIIDIVFLLIIFFLVVCQFIEAENFPVAVPDDCEFAQGNDEPGTQMTTITVMKTNEESIAFAVGSEKVLASAYPNLTGIVDKLVKLIDVRFRDLPLEHRIVTLRIDKDIRFAQAQYALAAVAASSATDIQLATLKEKRTGPQ